MPRRTPSRSAETRRIALLTDFGCAGHHAGVVRGVLLGINPEAVIVDLCNGIPAGDVALGAWTLHWSWRHFPHGTVHLAVVDPGVGTTRRALAAAAGGQFFVGPDNGLLSYALRSAPDAVAVALPLPRTRGGISSTFHGRDLFAPVAARLSLGEPLASLGASISDWVRLDEPVVRRSGPGRLEGEIVAIDHWGNLVTSLTERDLAQAGIDEDAAVRVGRGLIRGIRRTYAETKPGGAVALINSSGHLEIAVNQRRAETVLGARRGGIIRVRARAGVPRRAPEEFGGGDARQCPESRQDRAGPSGPALPRRSAHGSRDVAGGHRRQEGETPEVTARSVAPRSLTKQRGEP